MSEPPYYYYAVYRRESLWATLAARAPTSAAAVASELGVDEAELALDAIDASTFYRLTSGIEDRPDRGDDKSTN